MTVSFNADILPLFTDMDKDHMSHLGVTLGDYSYMRQPEHASDVYEQVSSGRMPPRASGEPPWSGDDVQRFKDWMDGGYQP